MRKTPSSLVLIPLLLVGVAACHQGRGSDIGPNLVSGPGFDYRAVVRDDSERPVVGANLRIAGSSASAATGYTGRAFLVARPTGTGLVTLDGTNAAAVDESRFGSITVSADLPDGDELPYVVYLPDHAPSFGATVPVGIQAANTVLDDDPVAIPANTGRSGARLTVLAGDSVTFGAATNVELRTGVLSVGHLPPIVAGGGSPLLVSRGIFVHPAGVQFANGATLSIPDDLALGAGQTVSLYYLDPALGQFVDIGTGAEAGGRIVAAQPAGRIRTGGLFCFGVAAATTTSITGRVLDGNAAALPGALVRTHQASTRTGADGRFTLPAVARTDASGVDRTITIRVHGGRHYIPADVSKDVTLGAAAVDAGDIVLVSYPSTSLRVLLLNRGRIVTNRRLQLSGRLMLSDSEAFVGLDGVAYFEEIAADVVGLLGASQVNFDVLFRNQNFFFLTPGVENVSGVFTGLSGWRDSPVGGTLIEAVDAVGTGPVYLAHCTLGDIPGLGYVGLTDLSGFLSVGDIFEALVTTTHQSEIDGAKVTAAFSMQRPLTGRLELPVERARRSFSGFGRFGILEGNLLGTGASNTRRARGSGSMTVQDFYDSAVFGRQKRRSPTQVAPTATTTNFRVGAPPGSSHLVGVEGSEAGGAFTLEKMGVALNVRVTEGAATPIDLNLVPVSTSFPWTNGAAGVDPSVLPNLRFSLAGQLSDGLVADLVRDVGGVSLAVTGNDVALFLPPLPTGLDRYLAVLGGVSVAGGVISIQRAVAALDGQTTPDTAQLPLPVITSPTPFATVSGAGFNVDFTLPAGCHYGIVDLRSIVGKDVLAWTVVVPSTSTQAKFFQFAAAVPRVLQAGRTWNLTVSAARIDVGVIADPRLTPIESYSRVIANYVGLPEAERGARAFSAVNISITTN